MRYRSATRIHDIIKVTYFGFIWKMEINELLFKPWEGFSFIAGTTQYVCSKKNNNMKR